jgi:hypothetical protein
MIAVARSKKALSTPTTRRGPLASVILVKPATSMNNTVAVPSTGSSKPRSLISASAMALGT